MENRIKLLLVGCGWIGLGAENDVLRKSPASHASAIVQSENFQLAGLCDPSAESLADVKDFYPEVPFFHSLDDALSGTIPDGIVIATPPDKRVQIIDTALRFGIRYFLCEKPLVEKIEETQELLTKFRVHDAKILVNHMRRFTPQMKKLKRYLQKERIRDTIVGDLLSGIAFYDKGLMHCGTHIIDLLAFIIGPVREVKTFDLKELRATDDFFADVVLVFDNCEIRLIPFNDAEYSLPRVELFGTRGSIKIDDMWGRKVSIYGTENSPDFSAYREIASEPLIKLNEVEPFMVSTYKHFYQAISGKADWDNSFNLSHNYQIFKAIHQSYEKSGSKIKIEELKIET